MNKKIAYILLAKPGAGKGTVAKYLKDKITQATGQSPFMIDTGELFRSSFKSKLGAPGLNDYHRERMKQIQDSGKLQVSALAVLMWCQHFCRNYTGTQRYFIIDGSPRRRQESLILTQYLRKFYKAKIYFVYVQANTEVVIQRMLERNKIFPRPEMNNRQAIEIRINDFNKFNLPVINAIKQITSSKRFLIIENNGTMEELIEKLNHPFFKIS